MGTWSESSSGRCVPHSRPGTATRSSGCPGSGRVPTPLRIDAQLTSSDVSVVRVVHAGIGPSEVDVPSPGCWRFSLSWAGHSDEMLVPYEGGSASAS